MDPNSCSICLLQNNVLFKANDMDSCNVKWSSKIIAIVPELEEIENYLICEFCVQNLEKYLKFRQLLLNLIVRWKLALEKKTVSLETPKHEKSQHETTCPLKSHEPKENIDNKSNFPLNKELKNVLNEKNYNIETELNNLEIIEPVECLNDNCDSSTDTPVFNTEYEEKSIKKCFKCSHCKNFYTNHKNLLAHIKYFSGESNTQPTIDIEKKNLTKKTRGRKSLRIFECEICKEKFSKVRHIIDHYTAVHSYTRKQIKPYACDRCIQKCSTLSLLLQHLKYHDKDRTKMCPTCGKSFITSNDLMSHQYIHLNRRNYVCSECNKAFNTNKNLRTHILVVHTDRSLWRYHCKICEKKFPQKSNFDQHSKRHAGDKKHVCHICQKSFVSSSELKRHVQLHSNIKLFKCIPCGTEYKTQRSYKQHLDRKHAEGDEQVKTSKREKKFVCHICPSQFYEKAKLLRHLSRHSGAKPHTCTFCDTRFSDKAYLKQHLKLVHDPK